MSINCTNPPNAKRKKATGAADVIIDMSPWAEDFAIWRASQQPQQSLTSTEQAPGLQSGATTQPVDVDAGATTSTQQHDYLNKDHLNNGEEINGLGETK